MAHLILSSWKEQNDVERIPLTRFGIPKILSIVESQTGKKYSKGCSRTCQVCTRDRCL